MKSCFKPKRKYFNDFEVRVIIKLYPILPNPTIGRLIYRTESSIQNMARKLGLKKPEGFINSGGFKPNQKAWNKGVKGYMGSNATSFKKGNVPPQYKAIGSERLTKDGHIEVKIGHNEWESKHRLIWAEHNGAIPEGMIITFADGNTKNFSPSNLICITKKQNMERNSIQRYPNELRQALKALKRLKKNISNHGKK